MEMEDLNLLPASSGFEEKSEYNEEEHPKVHGDPGHVELLASEFEAEEGEVVGNNTGCDGGESGFVEKETAGEDLGRSEAGVKIDGFKVGLENTGNNTSTAGTEGKPVQLNLDLNIGGSTPEEGEVVPESWVPNEGDIEPEEGELPEQEEVDMDLVDSPVMRTNIFMTDTLLVEENLNSYSLQPEVGCIDMQNGSLVQNNIVDSHPRGIKRAWTAYDEPQPSVHVRYNHLTRASKRKLEELLQQWSEWHAKYGSSHNLDEGLESGEDTYFPALYFGIEKTSAVSFWIENEKKRQKSDVSYGLLPLESHSVPLYDRGYALGLTSVDGPSNIEGGLEIIGNDARCFNCGSYNHSLKECPKPRDHNAVNNARKLHNSKRNQNPARGATRYYQNSAGGKYEGLKPGALDAETRKLLGLGELDPPPWLNRMRELGYPPGYLDPNEDEPSGITMFSETDEGKGEDGEIFETDDVKEPKRKKTVEFPGINAPIPENADEKSWAVRPSSSDSFRNRSHPRTIHSSENIPRWNPNDPRLSRDYMEDRPPGVDAVFSPSSYPPRYGSFHFSRIYDSPRDPTPIIDRSDLYKGRSAVVYDDYLSPSSSSLPYSSSSRHFSPPEYHSARSEDDNHDRYRRADIYRSNVYDHHHRRSRRR